MRPLKLKSGIGEVPGTAKTVGTLLPVPAREMSEAKDTPILLTVVPTVNSLRSVGLIVLVRLNTAPHPGPLSRMPLPAPKFEVPQAPFPYGLIAMSLLWM